MRAAVFHEYGGPLRVEEVPDPAPPHGPVTSLAGTVGLEQAGSVSAGSCDGVAPGARSCAGGRARPA